MSEKTYLSDTYIEKKIKQYFKTHLSQYCVGDDAWSIMWSPNMAFERPDDLYWLDMAFNSNPPTQREIGTYGRNAWNGYLQIGICVPLNETSLIDEDAENEDDNDIPVFGNSSMDKCFNDIARVFRRGVIFDGIRIVKCCRYTSALQIYDDFCRLPVRIFWQADLSN